MKSIIINTAQQVKLEFKLATIQQRILAYLIDIGIYFLFYYVLIIIVVFGLIANNYIISNNYYYIIVLTFVFYSLFMEWISRGRSIGKYIMKIRIIQLNEDPPNFVQLLTRWLFRMIDIILSFGAVAILSIRGSQNSQRLGDLFAGTVVIVVYQSDDIPLKEIIARQQKNTDIVYQQATKMTEEIALLIKETIQKHELHNNDSTTMALDLLCEKISKICQINFPKLHTDRIKILKQVLKDYIQLTR